jgi:hypothetical protein
MEHVVGLADHRRRQRDGRVAVAQPMARQKVLGELFDGPAAMAMERRADLRDDRRRARGR